MKRRLPVAFLMAMSAACTPNGSSSSSGGNLCTPGQQIGCACGNNVMGFQVCGSDGTYQPCQCGGGSSSQGGSSGVSQTGSTGSASSGGASSGGSSVGSRPISSSTAATSMVAASSSGDTSGTSRSTSSSSSSSGGVFSSSSGAAGCGRPGTAVRPEESVCNSDNQCQCGLNCLGGQCLRPCTTPGVMDTCGAGKLCVATTLPGVNVCLRIVGRNADCTLAACDTGLECETGSVDQMDNPTSYACHLPCNMDGTCAGTDRCLESTPGFVEVEAASDGGIACDPDAGGTCGSSYECMRLSMGNPRCARPVRACGRAGRPYGFPLAGDGGLQPPAPDMFCNLGPTADFAGMSVPGSAFCDDYRTLPTPPVVFCQNDLDSNVPGAGWCVAFCKYFANGDGTVARDMDCPPGFHCTVQDAVYFNPAQATPTSPNTTCTTDADCSALPGAICTQLSGSGTVCAYPYGMCREGASSSSSSGGGGTSTGGGSSGPPASSGATSSSSGGASSASL